MCSFFPLLVQKQRGSFSFKVASSDEFKKKYVILSEKKKMGTAS